MRNYPLIKFILAFSTGLIISSFLSVPLFTQAAILLIGIVLSIILFFIKSEITKILSSYLILFSVSVVGMIYITASQIDKPNYPFEELFIKDALIDGRIEEIDLPSDKLVLTINVNHTLKKNKIVDNKYKVRCFLNYDEPVIEKILNRLRPGNRVVLLGNLQIPPNERNPGEFNYREYLRNKNIPVLYSSFNPMDFVIVDYQENFVASKIFEARFAIAKHIKRIYNNKTADLLKGLLLADRSEIGYDIKEGFIKSGVIHVLAVSGLHVGFIILILVFILGRSNIYLRISLTIIGLLAFMVITGMSPSVTRATIMAILLLISYLRSNKQNNFNTLSLAAFIILAYDPTQIFSPGFQLSFSAVTSIFVFFPRFRNIINSYFHGNKLTRYTLLFASVSLAAQIGTIPFTIYYFGKLSIVSLLANLVIIPLIGFIVGLGIFTLFFSVISIYFVQLFVLSNEFLVNIIFGFIKYISSHSFTYLSIPNYSIIDGVVYFVLLAIFTSYYKKLVSYRTKILFTFLVVANLVIWSKVDDKQLLPDGKLSVLFIEIEQSESALIKFPDNKTAMVNFGSATSNYSSGKNIILPLLERLGIDNIDYGIISHLDREKYLGILELIDNNKIDTLFIPKTYGNDKETDLFNNYLQEKDIVVKEADETKLELSDSRVYILSQVFKSKYKYFNILNKSAPVKLVYGNNSILFLGGIEKRGEKIIIDGYGKFLHSDIMQIANYGSNVSTSKDLLQIVDPLYSVISVQLGNYLEYPSNSVLQEIENTNIKLHRTDNDGAILFICNGNNIEFVDWRSY